MKQKNKFIKERLKHKQEQLSMQAIRQERLNRTMQNTKDDIDQLIYALHELEEAEKGNHKRHTIPYNEVFSFFTRICRLFDYLQHGHPVVSILVPEPYLPISSMNGKWLYNFELKIIIAFITLLFS